MLKSYKIDSLKLNIPLDKCTIPEGSDLLNEPKFVPINLETGDIDFSTKGKVKNYVNGLSSWQEIEINEKYPDRFLIPVKYSKSKIVTGRVMGSNGKSRPVHSESIAIQISSKALQERYFEGITRENMNVLYEHIIKSGQVLFSWETFEQSEFTDVDICADFESDVVLPNLRRVVKSSLRERYKELCKSYNRNNNQGLELGTRKSSCIEKPYLKVYHKRKQMQFETMTTNDGLWKRNYEYAETYLQGGLDGIPENLIRLEFNLKNNEVFEHYLKKTDNLFAGFGGGKLNTLQVLTSVSQDQWKSICADVWSKWLHVQSAYMTNTFPEVKYTGARNSFEAMFIGMLWFRWQNAMPNNLPLAQADALQLYHMAMRFADFKESERSTFRKRAEIPMMVMWVYERMQSETNVRLLHDVRKMEMHNEALHLLYDMQFPVTDVDMMVGWNFEQVGRLGLYDVLNEQDKHNDTT